MAKVHKITITEWTDKLTGKDTHEFHTQSDPVEFVKDHANGDILSYEQTENTIRLSYKYNSILNDGDVGYITATVNTYALV